MLLPARGFCRTRSRGGVPEAISHSSAGRFVGEVFQPAYRAKFMRTTMPAGGHNEPWKCIPPYRNTLSATGGSRHVQYFLGMGVRGIGANLGFLALSPGLERHGYYQTSLRDVSLPKPRRGD